MKELTTHIIPKDEKVIVKEVKKQIGHIVSMAPKPGQSVWQLNTFGYMPMLRSIAYNTVCNNDQKIKLLIALKVISVVTENDYETSVSLDNHKKKKLVMKGNCYYVEAINEKNAANKFLKMLRAALK